MTQPLQPLSSPCRQAAPPHPEHRAPDRGASDGPPTNAVGADALQHAHRLTAPPIDDVALIAEQLHSLPSADLAPPLDLTPQRKKERTFEGAVVRRIFRDYVQSNLSMRQISWQLNQDLVPSPSGKAVWGVSMIGRLIRNEAYVGRAYYNRTASVLDRHPTKAKRQIKRPRDQWIPIPVPAILDEELFEAAQRVSYDNSQWSPRRAEPNHWLLRGLVKCGHCGVSVSCHKMRGRNGTFHYYYYCRNHDPLRAGGEHRRCPERNVRAGELDAFVFDQVRATMLRPDVLLAGEAAVSTRREAGSDELLATQLASLDRKIDAVAAERRRLADLYQASFIEREELLRRGKELELRSSALNAQRQALIDQREELAQQNRLRDRVEGFARRVQATIDRLDFAQRQKLLRLSRRSSNAVATTGPPKTSPHSAKPRLEVKIIAPRS